MLNALNSVWHIKSNVYVLTENVRWCCYWLNLKQEKEMQLLCFEHLEVLTLTQVLVFNMICGRYYHWGSEKLMSHLWSHREKVRSQGSSCSLTIPLKWPRHRLAFKILFLSPSYWKILQQGLQLWKIRKPGDYC